MHRRSSVIAFLCLALATLPSFAYTVILKDGSKVQAKKKYRVVGDKAVITLVNGSESFLLISQIDVERTDRENQNDYGGTSVVIDSGKPATGTEASPPPRAPSGSLADLIKSRNLDSKLPEPSVRPKSPAPPRLAPGAPPRPTSFYETPAGKTSKRPFPNTAVTDTVATYLREQGLEEFRLYAGSKSGRLLIEATTASEASAFKAITVSANALIKVQAQSVSALELTMATPAGERAGTFLITPEAAAELAANKLEVSAFYVRDVQF